jgi:hypothetical protein
MESEELVLKPSTASLLWPLVACLAFVAIGAWMLGSSPGMGWLVIVVFGLGLVVLSVQLLPGSSQLRIGPDGFQERSLFRARSFRWQDIKGFVPYRASPRTRVWRVGFFYRDDYVPPKGRAGRLGVAAARSLAGVEGGLSSNFGRSAQELADLLNSRLQQAHGSGEA